MSASDPRPIIDRITPQTPRLGFASARIEHRQGRLIGEQLVRRQHRAEHQLIERRQPPARASHPVAQCRTIQRDALPLKHLCLTVERKSITELANHDVRHQRFRCHATIDWPLRRRGLHHGALAASASIAWPANHLHPQLGGNQVEHLGAVIADQVQCAATTRALLALDVDDHLVARQMCRQCTAIAMGHLDAPPSFVSAQLSAHSKMGRGGTVMVSTINEVDTIDERSLKLLEA
jgi:hypothetical protein